MPPRASPFLKKSENYLTTSLKHEQESYTCGTYRRHRNQCSAHYIRVVVLEELVLQNLQRVVAMRGRTRMNLFGV